MGRSDWQGIKSNPMDERNERKNRPLLRQILTEPPIQAVEGVHLSRFGTGWQEWPKFQTCKKLESHIKFQGTCTVVVTHDGQFNFSLLPPRPRHTYLPDPLHFQPRSYAFYFLNVLTTMAPAIAFLNFAPTPFALYFPLIIFLIVCFLFFLVFFPIFPWHLPDFLQSIARHPLQVAFSPLNISSVPPAFTTLFLNFFCHNVSTRNSVLCNLQMLPPITFLNIALTHLAINDHTLTYTTNFSLRQVEVTTNSPYSIYVHGPYYYSLIKQKSHPSSFHPSSPSYHSSFEPRPRPPHRKNR